MPEILHRRYTGFSSLLRRQAPSTRMVWTGLRIDATSSDSRRSRQSAAFVWICFALMVLGCLLRLYDVHLTAYDISKHDLGYAVGMTSDKIGAGHIGYIEYICKHRALPNFNPTTRWSFYNPPFFHVCAALALRLWTMLGIPEAQAWELVQYLPCLIIGAAVVGIYLILRELRIHGWALVGAVALVSFHPTLTYLSLALNNDALAFALTVWAVWFVLRWFRSPKTSWILGVALCVGLGMMTKLTVALVAPPIALLFLYTFFKKKQWLALGKQFALFAAVCCPLGLFWSIRNLWLYKIPFQYVQALPAGSAQNVSGFSLWERFGLPPLQDFLRLESSWTPASEIGFADHNLWSQTLRTALFDDNALTITDGLRPMATALVVVTLMLTLLMVVLTLLGLFRNRSVHVMIRLFVGLSALLLFGNFVKFCYDYPMTCTIHFRYLPTCLLWGSMGLGFWWQSVCERPRKKVTYRLACAVLCLTLLLIGLFCLLSAMLYLQGLPRLEKP